MLSCLEVSTLSSEVPADSGPGTRVATFAMWPDSTYRTYEPSAEIFGLLKYKNYTRGENYFAETAG